MITLVGAKKAREIVFAVLRDACIDEDLSIPEAIDAVKDIFSKNSLELYKIKAASMALDLDKMTGSSFLKIDDYSPTPDITLVRIVWVDASGQHRWRIRLLPFKLFIYHWKLHCRKVSLSSLFAL